jgi:hypothetical protein
MRLTLIAFAVVASALAIGARPSAAGYNARYCTDGGAHDESGALECAYHTWQQCLDAASGRGMHCTINPDYAWRERGYDNGRRRPVRRY